MFVSVTDWQAIPYMITVRVPGFPTREQAETFGNSRLRLTRDGAELVLSTKDGIPIARLKDSSVTVQKLKESARKGDKPFVIEDDFEPVNIPIAEFVNHKELSSFGSLAYGVEIDTR